MNFHFNDFRDDSIPLDYYRRKQNPEGGFPYDMKPGSPTSNNETCGVLGVLAELDLADSDAVEKAVEYMLSVQS
ncbi:MAG: hypothetical protein ACE5QW_09730 [Thermoplasmata archaeon]